VDANTLPLAAYPWNQILKVYPSLSLSMLGRVLRPALTFCNSEALEQMTQVVFKQVEQEQTKLYNNFLEVARADWAAVLVMVPLFFAFAVQTMLMAIGYARQRCALFPESKFFAAVDQKRASQALSLEQFTDAVLRRVTSEVAGVPAFARAEYAVLMWTEFLDRWMPTSFSGQYCEEARRQWMRVKQQGTSNEGGRGSRAQRPAQNGCSVSPDGGGPGGGGGSGAAARSSPGGSGGAGGSGNQEIRRTIPCAMDVVGDTLGVPSAHPCRSCLPKGRHHSNADCPKRWIKAGFPLPGFLPDGTRDPSAWRGSKEPIKATIAAWIAFLQEPSHFIATGPTQAGVPERQNWETSSGDSRRHLQGNDRAEGGQGFFPRRRKDPFPR
jgi:hypothetical protein